MEFLITSTEIRKQEGASELFEHLRQIAKDAKGYCYYRYPITAGFDHNTADITVVDLDKGVIAIDVLPLTPLAVVKLSDELWTIDDVTIDSPLLKLEDYKIGLLSRYDKYRPIRGLVKVNTFVYLPNLPKAEFYKLFGDSLPIERFIFSDLSQLTYPSLWKETMKLTDPHIRELFLSVSQGAGRLNNYKRIYRNEKATSIGDAIQLLDTKIATLDNEQHAAAIQIPDGPQRIRGMAGTGKTIILTMKAAYLHSLYPEKKILYTFHTQSLYNQVRNLITKFYRDSEEKDPNWDNLLVLHSWGGRGKEGVYSRTSLRNSAPLISYYTAKSGDSEEPLRFICNELLKRPLQEEFDFVLIDEAQDLPPSFFQVIYAITKDPKRIIFAYDELQSLNTLSVSDTGDLFGYNPDGSKRVSFEKGTYDGGIEMDHVLAKSYRNPLDVLMVAHSLGLGLYNTDGDMQIIDDPSVWQAIGYNVIQGTLKTPGEAIIIERPSENSRSLVNELYSGSKPVLEYRAFPTINAEVEHVVNKIVEDVKIEKVNPESIVVISMNPHGIEKYMREIQHKLFEQGIPSIIPGIGGIDKDKFGEPGFVTLSTVFKAKGNEAFIVYIVAFDHLYDYVDFVLARNRAFTSISRAKGWCRISGVGPDMNRAVEEINKTRSHIPRFEFTFPDPNKIAKRLSQEELARRLDQKKRAQKAVDEILKVEEGALKDMTEEAKEALRKKLGL